MDAVTITALASAVAIVLRAVTELVKALRSRRDTTGTEEPERVGV